MPDPVWPMIAVEVPGAISNETSSSAWTCRPYEKNACSTVMTGETRGTGSFVSSTHADETNEPVPLVSPSASRRVVSSQVQGRPRRRESRAANGISSPSSTSFSPCEKTSSGGAGQRHAPVVHHDHAVGLERLLHEVRHVDERGARRGETPHHAQDREPAADVEQRRRLVEHQHGGLHCQGAGDAHTLALPAGEARGIGLRIVVHGNAVQLAGHARGDLIARDPQVLRPKGNVVRHDARDDLVVRVLEHQAERASRAPVGLEVRRPACAHLPRPRAQPRLVRGEQPADHRGERRLAGAVGAEHAEALAARELEGDVVECGDAPLVEEAHVRKSHQDVTLRGHVLLGDLAVDERGDRPVDEGRGHARDDDLERLKGSMIYTCSTCTYNQLFIWYWW